MALPTIVAASAFLYNSSITPFARSEGIVLFSGIISRSEDRLHACNVVTDAVHQIELFLNVSDQNSINSRVTLSDHLLETLNKLPTLLNKLLIFEFINFQIF